MPTQVDVENDYKRLKVLLDDTDNSVIIFILYRDIKEQRKNANRLKNIIDIPVTEVALKGDNLNPIRTFLDLPKDPRQAIFYTFLGSSLPEGKSDFDKFAGYVNIQREAFEDAPHAVVLWLREEQLVRLMRRAPDFWAWRSGVFDFRGELVPDDSTYRELEEADAFDRESLEEQVALYREILKGQLERDEPDLAYITRTRLRLAKSLLKLGLYGEMAREAQKAKELATSLGDDELRNNALNSLALAYERMGDHSKAEPLFREATEAIDEAHPEYATALNNLAGLVTKSGRFKEAEQLYRKALEKDVEVFGEGHPKHAVRLNNLATLLWTTGRHSEAESLYRQAAQIGKDTLGEYHPEYASRLGNLAGLLAETAHYDEAEHLYDAAKNIYKEALGKDHPEYLRNLNNMAGLLMRMERYEEAKPLFYEALSNCRMRLGEDHPNTQIILKNYNKLLERLEKSETTF